MLKRNKLAHSVALAIAGSTLVVGAMQSAQASTTMYNRYNEYASDIVSDGPTYPSNGSQTGGTDGWVWGSVGGRSNGNPNAAFGWVGTTGPNTSPFLTTKAMALNWAAHLTAAGDSLEISQADAYSRYGIYADLDTAAGAWHQEGPITLPNGQVSDGNGWKHNIDIGLFKSDVTQQVTLNIAGRLHPEDNFGITVYTGLAPSEIAYGHHGAYYGNNMLPFEGMPYLTHTARDPITYLTANSLTFTANAGQIYTIVLGGNNGQFWDGKYDSYILNITSVPVPGAAWLFGSAVLGLAGMRRRKTA